jgi:nitrile hydratase subunit beta
MDGVHDIGGLQGFGAVERVPAEPVFGEEWERRAFAATMAVLGTLQSGGAVFRHSIERMDPAHYLSSSYYEHWLTAASTLLVEAGVISQAELERRAGGPAPVSNAARGTPPRVPGSRLEGRFAVGDRVRVREWHPDGHTRAPRYVQGKRGVVARVDGPANLPDVEAHGGGLVSDPTYSIRFSAAELWGEGGGDGEVIYVDLWEFYLEEDG